MEFRYVIAGVSAILISAAFVAFSVLTGNTTVLGVSLSTLVLGIVVATIGLTYTEPLGELLKHYAVDTGILLTRLLEDAGLAGQHKLLACSSGNSVLAVFSEKKIECRDVEAGIGIRNGTVYLAVPLSATSRAIESALSGEGEARRELADYLRGVLVESLRLARDLRAYILGDGTARVELAGLSDDARRLARSPVNPLRLAVVAALAGYGGGAAEILEEEFTGSTYTVRARIGGS